jgi:hypothetical protein
VFQMGTWRWKPSPVALSDSLLCVLPVYPDRILTLFTSILKMKVCSFETVVSTYTSRRCCNSEDQAAKLTSPAAVSASSEKFVQNHNFCTKTRYTPTTVGTRVRHKQLVTQTVMSSLDSHWILFSEYFFLYTRRQDIQTQSVRLPAQGMLYTGS